MWNWLSRKRDARRKQDLLFSAVDRISDVATDLERHNQLLENLSPTVGLYQTFQVNTGAGVVDAVLYDLEVQPDSNGCPKFVGGKVMSRREFDSMMTTPEAFAR